MMLKAADSLSLANARSRARKWLCNRWQSSLFLEKELVVGAEWAGG